MNLLRLKAARQRQRAIQWEHWQTDRPADHWREELAWRYRTLSRDYGKPKGSDAKVLDCLVIAEKLNALLHELHKEQKAHEQLGDEEKYDFAISDRAMALYSALHVGTTIHSLRSALKASTVRWGNWRTIHYREEREEKKQQEAALKELVDGPLSELR